MRSFILATLATSAWSVRSVSRTSANLNLSVRGVGQIPTACESWQDRIGAFCYDKCPTGWYRFGFDCHTSCPAGFRDDGLFCRLAEYGRGFGYPAWQGGTCSKKHKQGCEMCLAMYYPKCKPGYKNIGCNICRPSPPNCAALGMGGRSDTSCAKKVRIGTPVLGKCASSQDRDAGLCYKKCPNKNYAGVGPVCWARGPNGWVGCGMGAAKSSKACSSVLKSQLVSVGTLAMTVSTLGTVQGGAGPSTGTLADVKRKYEEAKKAYDAFLKANKNAKKAVDVAAASKKVYSDASKGYVVYNKALTQSTGKMTAADMIRIAAEMAALLDTSGAAATIAAYSYPKCSKLR